jgi:excisionase family DNA binding protein
MTDRILIPLPGIGTLELTRQQYAAALRPIAPPQAAAATPPSATEFVTAKALAARLSFPVSCIYEYARCGRIPCVRAGKHVRFNPEQVLQALRLTGNGQLVAPKPMNPQSQKTAATAVLPRGRCLR